MKFEHYLNKLHESKEFKNFKNKHKKSYLCAGFFVLDFETGKHMHQVDYSLPNKKIATFFLDEGIKTKISEQALKKELPELKGEIKTDLEALKGIVEDEMKNRTVTERVKKIIAILHVLDGKPVWNLQCILDGLALLNVHVSDEDKSVLKFEKHSLLDLIKSAPSFMIKPKAEKAKEEERAKQEKEEKGEVEGEEAEQPEITLEKIKKELEKIEKVKKK